jgi:peptidylprolyl isomerase
MTRTAVCLLALLMGLPLVADEPVKPATPRPKVAKKKAKPAPKKEPAMITTASGLKYVDTQEGTGASPTKGQTCVIHYTGWLSDKGQRGKKFDSSVDRNDPFSTAIGVGRVIKGWDEGVLSMKVGGKRTLYIPAPLGYGARGAGGDIPPNADLIFDVELISIK